MHFLSFKIRFPEGLFYPRYFLSQSTIPAAPFAAQGHFVGCQQSGAATLQCRPESVVDAYAIWNVSSATIEVPKHMALGYATLNMTVYFRMGMFAIIYYYSGNIYYFGGLVFLF